MIKELGLENYKDTFTYYVFPTNTSTRSNKAFFPVNVSTTDI